MYHSFTFQENAQKGHLKTSLVSLQNILGIKLILFQRCIEITFMKCSNYRWVKLDVYNINIEDHELTTFHQFLESLKTHLAKDYVQIDPTLLERLVRAGIICPAFTERQKMTLLQTARMDCPQDILHYLISGTASPNPASTTTVTSVSNGLNHIQYSSPNSPILMNTSSQPQNPYNTSTAYPQKSNNYNTMSWDKNQDMLDIDPLFVSPTNTPISSLIRDIQQNCYFDEQKPSNTSTQANPAPLVHKGIPLLLQPNTKTSIQQTSRQQPLSPWAQSYAPTNKANSDIWRMASPAAV